MAKKMQIDFSGVDKEIRKGGGGSHIPEGDYLAKVVEGEVRKSDRTGGRYINWRLQITAGEYKGKTVYLNTSLKPEALWNLRNLIYAALGKNVAGKSLAFNPEAIYGKVVAITCTDNEYEKNGKMKMTSQVDDVRPKDELESSEEDDEEEETEEVEDEVSEDEELEEVDLDEI